ncbi:MAG TPA: hypothetical protein VI461_01715 [Chitinophagaceae bacterium]|nr:hypothetical protein [Chitinophagaceae bacterium]
MPGKHLLFHYPYLNRDQQQLWVYAILQTREKALRKKKLPKTIETNLAFLPKQMIAPAIIKAAPHKYAQIETPGTQDGQYSKMKGRKSE